MKFDKPPSLYGCRFRHFVIPNVKSYLVPFSFKLKSTKDCAMNVTFNVVVGLAFEGAFYGFCGQVLPPRLHIPSFFLP